MDKVRTARTSWYIGVDEIDWVRAEAERTRVSPGELVTAAVRQMRDGPTPPAATRGASPARLPSAPARPAAAPISRTPLNRRTVETRFKGQR